MLLTLVLGLLTWVFVWLLLVFVFGVLLFCYVVLCWAVTFALYCLGWVYVFVIALVCLLLTCFGLFLDCWWICGCGYVLSLCLNVGFTLFVLVWWCCFDLFGLLNLGGCFKFGGLLLCFLVAFRCFGVCLSVFFWVGFHFFEDCLLGETLLLDVLTIVVGLLVLVSGELLRLFIYLVSVLFACCVTSVFYGGVTYDFVCLFYEF